MEATVFDLLTLQNPSIQSKTLRNKMSKEFTIDQIKKTGLNRSLKVFLSIIILYILMIF